MVRLILTAVLLLGTAGRVASAAELRVPPGGLVNALATARPGETLILLPGIHPGPLTIAAPVRLVGEPGAILEGDGSGPVLVLTADDIQVSDLTVRGSGADLSRDDAVVLLHEAHRITVERCRIEARAFGETPYRLQTTASALMARRPAVRWFWMSPALAVLDWWQARIARPAETSFDPYPLVTTATAPHETVP
ncbi:MAG: hypothetical protein V3T72_14020 [Thermoanaerobaculia bacterium]